MVRFLKSFPQTPRRQQMPISPNGYEYDTKEVIEFDEEHAFVTATEYKKDGVIVQRDVHARLKKANDAASKAFQFNKLGELNNG